MGDTLKDLLPDDDLSLPAFNVVTESYDSRSLKPTLLELKTMRNKTQSAQDCGRIKRPCYAGGVQQYSCAVVLLA
eukprot:jgi/Tetstr1/424607/TSEL_015129.t1